MLRVYVLQLLPMVAPGYIDVCLQLTGRDGGISMPCVSKMLVSRTKYVPYHMNESLKSQIQISLSQRRP